MGERGRNAEVRKMRFGKFLIERERGRENARKCERERERKKEDEGEENRGK